MYSVGSQFTTTDSLLSGMENFAAWKSTLQSVLQTNDLWGCIVGDPEYTKNQDKDTEAKAVITMSIDSDMCRHIDDAETAKEAWDALLSVFGDSGLLGKIESLIQTVPKCYQLGSFSSIEEYIEVIKTSFRSPRERGVSISDEWIGFQMLAGLTEDYWPLVVELDTLGTIITGLVVEQELLEFHVKYFIAPTFCEITPMYVDSEEENGGDSSTTLTAVSEGIGQEEAEVDASSPPLAIDVRTCHENTRETAYLPGSSHQHASTSGTSNASHPPPYSWINKSDLEVEVRGPYGEYYEGIVTDVFEGEVEVSLDHEGQTTSRFAFSDVRLPSKVHPELEVQVGQEVEVYTRRHPSSSWAWWTADIVESEDNNTIVLRMSTSMESESQHVECVEHAGIGLLRTPNVNPPIDIDTFHKIAISVPEEQRESAGQANIHMDFQRAIGAALRRYVPEKGVLLLISRNGNLRSLSTWLEDFQARKAQESAHFLEQTRSSTSTSLFSGAKCNRTFSSRYISSYTDFLPTALNHKGFKIYTWKNSVGKTSAV